MSPDEQAIRDAVEQWHSATAQGDVETVLGLMSEDAVFLVSGKRPMKGRMAFERQLRKVLKDNKIVSRGEVQEIEVANDLAYCWTQLQVRIVPIGEGEPQVRSGSALSIFRKQGDGSWLLTRDANLLPTAG